MTGPDAAAEGPISSCAETPFEGEKSGGRGNQQSGFQQ